VIRKAYPGNKKLQRRKHVFPSLNCVLQLTKLSDSLASKSCFRCGKLRCHVDKKKGRRGPFFWSGMLFELRFPGLVCFMVLAVWCGPRASRKNPVFRKQSGRSA
jgi:hypothetical protein